MSEQECLEQRQVEAMEENMKKYAEFFRRAISILIRPGEDHLHSVYSGFNSAFRVAFPDVDPVWATLKLAARGVITIRPARGGVYVSIPGAGDRQQKSASDHEGDR